MHRLRKHRKRSCLPRDRFASVFCTTCMQANTWALKVSPAPRNKPKFLASYTSSLICPRNMVTSSTIVNSNTRFANERHNRAACVFAGATADTGLATLRKMAIMLHSSTFYILGRSLSRFGSHLEQLKQIGPSNASVSIA